MEPSQTDRILAVLCHLCVFVGFIFIGPLVVFFISNPNSPWLREQAREALNFHISVAIYAGFSVLLCLILCLPLGLPLLMALGIGVPILAIIAAVRAAEGGLYRYPLTIRLV